MPSTVPDYEVANTVSLNNSPAFLRVQKAYPTLHLNLLSMDRWELINRDMVTRAQGVRAELASKIEGLAQPEIDDEVFLSLTVDMAHVLVRSFIIHDGAMGHEDTLNGVKSLALHIRAFDQALELFFDVASTFLRNARSRYQMKLLVERDVVRSYDYALKHLTARHFVATHAAQSTEPWSPTWAIKKVEWFRVEFEERYDGLLSAFGGTTLFKDPYLRGTHRLLVEIQRKATAEMIVMKATGHILPLELVDYISEYLYDDAGLLWLCGRIIGPPSTL